MIKRTLIIFIFSASVTCLAGQQNDQVATNVRDCSGKLRDAESAYQAGQFLSAIEVLEESLDSCDLSRKQKELALELLAKSYLEAGENGKAETTVNILLKKFPHYDLREDRNPEMFNRMVKRYVIHPSLTIAVKNTGNWLRHKTIKSYSVHPDLNYSRPFDESGNDYWFNYYGCAEYEFLRGLSINIDASFYYSGFFRYIITKPGFPYNYEIYYEELNIFWEFPVYLKKYFYPGKNFILYLSGGYGPFWTDYAKATKVTLDYTEENTGKGMSADYNRVLENYNVRPIKNKLTWQWNAGAGIGYSIKNLRFFMDARYLGGVGSLSAPEKSDLLPVLKEEFFYIDQEMKIDQFEVGITISYTLFNSVKKKKQ